MSLWPVRPPAVGAPIDELLLTGNEELALARCELAWRFALAEEAAALQRWLQAGREQRAPAYAAFAAALEREEAACRALQLAL
jgi:hypothetical protein